MERSAPRDRQSGFALLFVFVLILVLVVSGLLIAGTTRTDTQVVNTIRNERIAFYAAEAGIAEAFQRLGLASGATASPSGVGTFDPTFKGAFAPDSANVNWQAQIAFASAGTYPSLYDANTVVTPSIQPTSAQLPYSTATVPSTDNLRLQWSVCTAVDAARGCEAVNTIRKIDGKNVLQIVSTGRSGPARRQLTMDLFLGDATSAVVLRSDICPGVNAQGSGTIEFPGGVTVNSDCDTAVRTKGAAAITAEGPIDVVGGGWSGDITPPPTTNQPPADDPLIGKPVPLFADFTVRNGTEAAPSKRIVKNQTVTLQPGIYYGGIDVQSNGDLTLASGVHIMAGGGFKVASNATVSGDGVMIYNTCSIPGACPVSGAGAYGAINVTSGDPINLSAMTTAEATTAGNAEWAGIVIFQDRLNPVTLSFTSNATGNIDGLIYAKIAQLFLSGGAQLLNSQLVVGSMDLQGGPDIGSPTDWLDLGGTGGTATAVAWSDR